MCNKTFFYWHYAPLNLAAKVVNFSYALRLGEASQVLSWQQEPAQHGAKLFIL